MSESSNNFRSVDADARYTLQQAAAQIEAVLPAKSDALKQVQRLATDRLVLTRRAAAGQTAPHVLGQSDVLAAAALRLVIDAGLHGEAIQAASQGLYAWNVHHPLLQGRSTAPATHPVTLAAADENDVGREWVLQIVRFLHPETGERRTVASCFATSQPFMPFPGITPDDDTGFVAEMGIAVRLTPIMLRLKAAVAAAKN